VADVKVLAFCGSLNPQSRTELALEVAAAAAAGAGAQVEPVRLKEYDLPHLYAPGTGSAEQVERLKKAFRESDALLIATPEYHGSFSGALKNAFDLMGFEEFEGKMAALIGVAGGSLGATNALNHLRQVCRQLHAWVLPDQVSVANARAAFDEDGRPADPRVKKRLQTLGVQLVKFAALHREASANPFVQMWEQLADNPGGE
jgi:FMN reductase